MHETKLKEDGMKRDMELIRKIVLAVEDGPNGYAPDDLCLGSYTPEQIAYHAYLLIDGGLAKGAITTHMGSSGPSAQVTSLTWEGHDFADKSRDETLWRKAMAIVQEKGGTVTIEILKDLLAKLARANLGL